MSQRHRVLFIALSTLTMLLSSVWPAEAFKLYNTENVWQDGGYPLRAVYGYSSLDQGHANAGVYTPYTYGKTYARYCNGTKCSDWARPASTLRIRTQLQVYKNGVWGVCGSFTSYAYNPALYSYITQSTYWDYYALGGYHSNCGANYYFSYIDAGLDTSWGNGTWLDYWVSCDAGGKSEFFG